MQTVQIEKRSSTLTEMQEQSLEQKELARQHELARQREQHEAEARQREEAARQAREQAELARQARAQAELARQREQAAVERVLKMAMNPGDWFAKPLLRSPGSGHGTGRIVAAEMKPTFGRRGGSKT